MYFIRVNLLAVLVSAISTMVLGFIWYSPLLFAKPLDARNGIRPE
jgi:uncharacterized membrane protein YpjA